MRLSKDPRIGVRDWVLESDPPPPEGRAEAEALAAAAREQGLVGLLHTRIVAKGPEAWPPEVRDGLRDTHRALLVRGIRQLDVAGRVQAHLLGRGLRVLPLKGAALAESAYDSVADRPMGDVDLLALDDWHASLKALADMGFRESGRGDHARALLDPATGTVLELHHAVTSCPGLFPVDRDGLWRRSRPGSGALARIPSAEDLLVQLSLHAAFQHGLVLSLVQYLDFHRVLVRLAPDPALVRALARAARGEGALDAALTVAAALTGARVDGLVSGNRRRAWLEGRLDVPTRFLAPEAPALGRVRLGVAEGRWWRLLRGTLAPIEPGERPSALQQATRVLRRTAHLAGQSLAGGPVPTAERPQFGGVSENASEPADGLDTLRDAALRACLAEFPHVRLTVTGECMAPVLRPGASVLVAPPERPARVGTVVLVRAPAGLRLHRLVWGPPFTGAGMRVRTKGDHSLAFDPALDPDQILGVVLEGEGGSPLRGRAWRRRTLRSLLAGLQAAVRARVPRGLRRKALLEGTGA